MYLIDYVKNEFLKRNKAKRKKKKERKKVPFFGEKKWVFTIFMGESILSIVWVEYLVTYFKSDTFCDDDKIEWKTFARWEKVHFE